MFLTYFGNIAGLEWRWFSKCPFKKSILRLILNQEAKVCATGYGNFKTKSTTTLYLTKVRSSTLHFYTPIIQIINNDIASQHYQKFCR